MFCIKEIPYSYYPFGMRQSAMSYFSGNSEQRNFFLYNGKELQTDFDLDWYDYGARFYDPQLGRWHVPDPMAEARNWLSSYSYVQNNPILRIDPNGMLDDGYEDGDGNYVWFNFRKEAQFKDKEGTTWSKVTDNKDRWNEAIVIREAVIDFLVQNEYDESFLRQNISLVGDSESDLFNKEVFSKTAITGGIVMDKSKWEDDVYNSGGENAYQTKKDINGYDVKCYPDKNGEKGPFMTIVTSNLALHTIDAKMIKTLIKEKTNISITLIMLIYMILINTIAFCLKEYLLDGHFYVARLYEIVIFDIIFCFILYHFLFFKRGIFIFATLWLVFSFLLISTDVTFYFDAVIFSFLPFIYTLWCEFNGNYKIFNWFLIGFGSVIIIGYFFVSKFTLYKIRTKLFL